MTTVTIQKAAEMLGVSAHSIYTYLGNRKLSGSARDNSVDLDSIKTRQDELLRKRVKDLDKIIDALQSNDLTNKERSALEMRSNGATYTEIAAAHKISWQGAQLIVKRVLKRDKDRTEP